MLNDNELKAMVSLLDDEDREVVNMIEKQIFSLGETIIPFLEEEWTRQFNPLVQKRIELLLHSLNFNLVKQRLANWVKNEQDDLLKGMWAVATYQFPDLKLETLREHIQEIYYDTWRDLRDDLHPSDQISILNNIFFNQYKFKPNAANFNAVANSMLNTVLETKKGNPITLCVIYLLVAQKLKLPIYGVNLPNLFVLTYKTEQQTFYINVFNKGLIFMRADIDNYIQQLRLNHNDMFYQPCSHLDIIRRVLRNLIVSYEKLNDSEKLQEVKQLLTDVLGDKVGN